MSCRIGGKIGPGGHIRAHVLILKVLSSSAGSTNSMVSRLSVSKRSAQVGVDHIIDWLVGADNYSFEWGRFTLEDLPSA